MGKSRINNPEKLAILGTQETGRRQTKSTQNKTHTTQKTKNMIVPNCIIFSCCYVFTSLQKKVCTRNHVRFTELQCTGSDLHISNYIL